MSHQSTIYRSLGAWCLGALAVAIVLYLFVVLPQILSTSTDAVPGLSGEIEGTAAAITSDGIRLGVIIGGPVRGYYERVAAVNEIDELTGSETLDELVQFLLSPTLGSNGDAESIMREASVRNDVINRLIQHPLLPLGFGEVLRKIYRSESQHVCMRDYAIQHVAGWVSALESRRGESPEQKDLELAACRALLIEALGETDSSIAGTALIALGRTGLSNAQDLGLAALEILSDGAASGMARTTALHFCVENSQKGAAGIARDIISDESGIALKVSAISALGRLGNSGDRGFLQALRANQSFPEYQKAIERALELLATQG